MVKEGVDKLVSLQMGCLRACPSWLRWAGSSLCRLGFLSADLVPCPALLPARLRLRAEHAPRSGRGVSNLPLPPRLTASPCGQSKPGTQPLPITASLVPSTVWVRYASEVQLRGWALTNGLGELRLSSSSLYTHATDGRVPGENGFIW